MSGEISLKFSTSKLFEKLKNLVKPYDDLDSDDDKIGKSVWFSTLYVYGILLRSYLRYKSTLTPNDRQACNILQFASFVPVIASIMYCPKNIVPVLLGVTTEGAVNLV